MNEIAPAKEERYWKTLKEELLQQTVTEAGAQELTSEPDVLCIRLWTSAKVLEGVEFCGILNRALRRDDAELLGCSGEPRDADTACAQNRRPPHAGDVLLPRPKEGGSRGKEGGSRGEARVPQGATNSSIGVS